MDQMPAIDVVIAWVDGSDPQQVARRAAFLGAGAMPHAAAAGATRFADCGEVYYCIASILKYAPFVRRIWIVSDNQRPPFLEAFAAAGLCRQDRIQVVDHTVIFAGHEHALPTFNSLSIETVVWRIPGLAEQFVYCNDDFFLNRPVQPADWFAGGRPVLHGVMTRSRQRRLKAWLPAQLRKLAGMTPATRPNFVLAQELGAREAGVGGDFLTIGHHPHPLRRSVLAAFFDGHPARLAENIRHRFRGRTQFSTVALANHLEIAGHGAAPLGPWDVAFVEPHHDIVRDGTLGRIQDGSAAFGCFQSLDESRPATMAAIRRVMRDKLGTFLPAPIRFPDEAPQPRSSADQT
jgi:hypothetical protein